MADVQSLGYQTSSDVNNIINNISSLNLTSLTTSGLDVTSGAFDLGGPSAGRVFGNSILPPTQNGSYNRADSGSG